MNTARRVYEKVSALLEAQFNSSYYFSDTVSFQETIDSGNYFSLNLSTSTGDRISVCDFDLSKSMLSEYRKCLGSSTSAQSVFNYIYKLSGPIKAVNLDDTHEFEEAVNDFIVDNYRDIILKDDRGSGFVNRFAHHLLYDKFSQKYEGVYHKGELRILVPESDLQSFANRLELVDGNAVRFSLGTSSDTDIPDFVTRELRRYTDEPQRRLNPDTVKWLSDNIHKPYDSITLYRSSGIEFGNLSRADYWADLFPEQVEKLLFKYFGVRHLEDLQRGQTIKVKRGKESSWSTKPQIARNFSSEFAKKDINLLLKSIVPASRVVVDFNLFPQSYLKANLPFWTQNEVIVSSGAVPAVISGIWLKPKVITWLETVGYSFSASTGISRD